MGCEDFGNCGIPQRGYQQDHVQEAAHAIARELNAPDVRIREHGMNAIRQEVYNMGPNQAERFTTALDMEMGRRGQSSPLREVRETRRDGRGYDCETGNELLVLNDPYDGRRGGEVLKQIRHEQVRYEEPRGQVWDERPPVVIRERPIYNEPVYRGPVYRDPGYRDPVGDIGGRILDRAVDGFGLGVGLNAADRLFGNRHR